MTRSSRIVTPGQHVAGAPVLQGSPFGGLEVNETSEPLSAGMYARWVMPFYGSCLADVDKTVALLHPIYHEITPDLVLTLLGPLNWRPRITAAYFTAFRRFGAAEQTIGRLLLRSDVCYAGIGYCLALARLNTEAAVSYLREYLGYYLTRLDLDYDQRSAMAALVYLDRANGTSYASGLMPRWDDFIRGQLDWSLEDSCRRFARDMQAIEAISSRMPRCPGE